MKIGDCGRPALGQQLGIAWDCAAPPACPLPLLHGVRLLCCAVPGVASPVQGSSRAAQVGERR